ncbi:MAG: UDP-N-acetylmuramate--L-alanine ligase [Solobacterium sp.]|nr:UDP-N-acetylmuramate--L-alanine ligase [Solobacterium sp.]
MEYFFIGIKGTGMAALACMLHDLGHHVTGSDLDKHFFTEEELHKRNIPIYDFNPENIKDNMHVIIGNAFLEDFPEVQAARANKTCVCARYHEFVGEFLKPYKTVTCAGSHGKSTTTGMVSCMLPEAGETGWLIGDGEGHITKDTVYFALEADEFRRHFLAYHPAYAIVTNVDIDHVDYFKDKADYRSAYEQFSMNVTKGMVIFGEDEEARMMNLNPDVPHYWYGLEDNDDIQAVNVDERNDGMDFDVLFNKEFFGHFSLPFVGHHLLLNSLGTISVGILEGMTAEQIERGLSRFTGVKRRFVIETDGDDIFVDDYAHHPTEVGVVIDAAHKRWPDRKLVAIFKPHRASRVKYFADDFARALKKADRIYLCDFTSIDDKQDGTNIDITYLQERLPESVILTEDEAGAEVLSKEKPAVFLFMSSKDIYWLANLVKRSHNS